MCPTKWNPLTKDSSRFTRDGSSWVKIHSTGPKIE